MTICYFLLVVNSHADSFNRIFFMVWDVCLDLDCAAHTLKNQRQGKFLCKAHFKSKASKSA